MTRARYVVVVVLAMACAESPEAVTRPPVFDRQVRAVLAARCDRCHAGDAAVGMWRSSRYLDAIACVGADGPSAVARDGDGGVTGAPILRALDRLDHQGVVNERERGILRAWVEDGARAREAAIHPPGIVDPRSADFHGRLLRGSRWAPMLDASGANACGRCHAGTPVRPRDVVLDAPGATDCRACHTRSEGVLACDTCHGRAGSAEPRVGDCLSPGNAGAHAAHRVPRGGGRGLTCGTCHPSRDAEVARGEHGDGRAQVVFDTSLAGANARYEASTGTCTVACHARGGTTPTPRWSNAAPLGCNGCHGNPPARHPPGACSACHAEADATGTSLRGTTLHMNGRVDVGDATGTCASCHGSNGTPWPTRGVHALHRDPPRSRLVACENCHPVPTSRDSAGHLDGVVQVQFSGVALARRARPSWSSGTCAAVACHGEGLGGAAPALGWNDPASGRCNTCHGAPPSLPHTQERGCESVLCHGGEVSAGTDGPVITPSGRTRHGDGVVQFGRGP
jgi:predicted CxxxxCH...CXXCH cytochrome family protein